MAKPKNQKGDGSKKDFDTILALKATENTISSSSDMLGSYTGTPVLPIERPEQDADDL